MAADKLRHYTTVACYLAVGVSSFRSGFGNGVAGGTGGRSTRFIFSSWDEKGLYGCRRDVFPNCTVQ